MFPIEKSHIAEALHRLGMPDVCSATIRQIVALASELEPVAGEPFVRLELGNPGIPAEEVGIQAQCEALRSGVANQYPNIAGISELKEAASEFVKAFFNVNIAPKYIIPTVGSMQGSFTLQLLLSQRLKGKDTILFINPGFPAQRHQAKGLSINYEAFDIYDYRGKALEAKLEEILSKGNITGLLYSNPNNPAWINLTEEELEIIGRLATKYDTIVLEDVAYLGMDFRTDFSRPFQPPYIPTVARYTDNYIMLVSGSKIFSYAGERIATVCMSPAVYERTYQFFADFYDMPAFGDAYIYGVLYTASSGTSHSAQYALASMMKAAVDGTLPMVEHT
ncbi:MAG: pyridoxal phosphate-dependent aminotransferase, partial [Muribaculaceae bacterium]|nr:pyridoxal phosphate-dependent aminotransferase [Muribaculaceae bacterium]